MLTKLVLLLTVMLGTLTGYVDLRMAEVHTPALLLMSFACLLGAMHPNGAWRRALMLGLSVPLAHVIAHLTGATLPYRLDDSTSSFLALIPAFLGSYLGVGMRRLWAAQQEKEQTRP
jgi:hypothetical protein